MKKNAYVGHVEDGAVILDEKANLLDGTQVLVMPVSNRRGSPAALLAAMKAPPHLKPGDIPALLRAIEEGKRAISYRNPLLSRRRK